MGGGDTLSLCLLLPPYRGREHVLTVKENWIRTRLNLPYVTAATQHVTPWQSVQGPCRQPHRCGGASAGSELDRV